MMCCATADSATLAGNSIWAYDRKQLILNRRAVSDELSGQYVGLYDFPDGRLEVHWKRRVLPYRTVHKDQRVNAAAIAFSRAMLGAHVPE